MKLKNLLEAKNTLQKIVQCEFEAMVSWKLRKVVNAINEEFKIYDETKNNLIKKYGESNEQTQQVQVKPENMENYFKELNELLEHDIEISFPKIRLFQLENATIANQMNPAIKEGLKLTVSEIESIEWMIEE